MKTSVIDLNKTPTNSFGVLTVSNLLNEPETQNMSIAYIKLDGVNKKIIDTVSDACYFILDGEGVFHVGKHSFPVKKGCLVTIPKNTPYFDEGKMTLLAFRNPRYENRNVIEDK